MGLALPQQSTTSSRGRTSSSPRNREISLYLDFLKHLLDAAQGLTCPFLVFNQRKADMAISVLPKANPWTDGNFGFGQQLF